MLSNRCVKCGGELNTAMVCVECGFKNDPFWEESSTAVVFPQQKEGEKDE